MCLGDWPDCLGPLTFEVLPLEAPLTGLVFWKDYAPGAAEKEAMHRGSRAGEAGGRGAARSGQQPADVAWEEVSLPVLHQLLQMGVRLDNG